MKFSIKSFFSKQKQNSVDFNIKSVYDGHHKVTYRGVMAIRCPFDYVIYQMIISDLKPDLIIEIGTNVGGGALYLADLLENIGNGIVHTIDIIDQSHPSLKENQRIKLFTEGWENYDISETLGFEKILVIEDASHMYRDTLEAMKKFAPLVSKNSYLIVEDGIVNELGMQENYDGGPLRAINEFMKDEINFVIDRKWCDLFGKNATFNVNGYLKKV